MSSGPTAGECKVERRGQHFGSHSVSPIGPALTAAVHPSTSSGGIEPSGSTASQKENVKTQFITREGTYKQMTISEQLARPHRVATTQGSGPAFNAPVRVSFVRNLRSVNSLNELNSLRNSLENGSSVGSEEDENGVGADVICFNIGRELFIYNFNFSNVNGTIDWSKPIDKRVYKGTYPTSHDFNQTTATDKACSLLIGFSAGQIQMINPFKKEFPCARLFNEDRIIDKSPVTCLRWLPYQTQLFAAAHSSGHLYIYDEELTCTPSPPTYVNLKQSESFTVSNTKSRSPKNPVNRWSIGKGGINQFEFGGYPGELLLATASQDGFLRVFKYETMELLCYMRSYFGGLLCLAWSPDFKLIATGGEDDLLTVYSVAEKRVICRGQGHKSWVSQVAFDPFTCGAATVMQATNLHAQASGCKICPKHTTEDNGSSVNLQENGAAGADGICKNGGKNSPFYAFNDRVLNLAEQTKLFNDCKSIVYRIGSVSADTQLCLWDVCAEQLDHIMASGLQSSSNLQSAACSQLNHTGPGGLIENNLIPDVAGGSKDGTVKESKTSRLKKFHKRGLSFGNRHANATDRWARSNAQGGRSNAASVSSANNGVVEETAANVFGTPQCPKMDAIPLVEPLICKKISHERLTTLIFRQDCLVTACQEGFVCTWARPKKAEQF
ncbi:hypothetical protein M3Y99_01167600 [Aphelenchoides fujianensis]|nr:hypothetical protein M3Y99_01167600 [Aphelenchoides fujianensis]